MDGPVNLVGALVSALCIACGTGAGEEPSRAGAGAGGDPRPSVDSPAPVEDHPARAARRAATDAARGARPDVTRSVMRASVEWCRQPVGTTPSVVAEAMTTGLVVPFTDAPVRRFIAGPRGSERVEEAATREALAVARVSDAPGGTIGPRIASPGETEAAARAFAAGYADPSLSGIAWLRERER